jgi:hypothetical protein
MPSYSVIGSVGEYHTHILHDEYCIKEETEAVNFSRICSEEVMSLWFADSLAQF